MGYRSEVGLAITGQALTKVIEDVPGLTDLVKKCLSDVDEHIKSDDGNHLFIWNCTKWYDSFDDVAAMMNRLDDIDSNEYLFIRLGEEDSDTHNEGSWYDNDFEFGCVRQFTYHNGSKV